MICRPGRTWIVPALLFLLCAGCVVFAQSDSGETVSLHVGFGRTSFMNVNLADAKAAFKAFTKALGKRKGYDLDVVVYTYDSDEAFQSAVADGSLHLVIMTAWEYLSADLREYLEPRFLAIDSGYGPREYMLLVREDGGHRELADLREKHVVLLENTNCEMSEHWLTTLLLEQQLGSDSAFFGHVELVTKPTKALLPVFFGNADACVVSRPIFETMYELNPQLQRQLRSIAISEPLIDAVTLVAYDGWTDSRHRRDLIEALESLHEDPQGLQILTLFKAERLAPFEDRYMDGTRELKATHDRLTKRRTP